MKSYWLRAGETDTTLELRDQPIPVPGPRQILLRMRAAGLNRGEFIAGHGVSKTGSCKPAGMEGAGEIVETGPDATEWKPGQRLFGRLTGAFAEYALMEAEQAMEIPASLSWEDAAGVPVVYMTAHDMLIRQGKLGSAEWLFIAGVTSGIGVASLQIGKAIGARVAGTSGSATKLQQLEPLGLELALCTRQPDFHQQLMDATGGKGVDFIVNTVGGSVFAECIRSLGFAGRLATVGYLDGVLHADIDISALHARRLILFGVSNKMVDAAFRATAAKAFNHDIVPLLATGKIRPVVSRIYPLDCLDEAKAYMESNQHLGKIVVTI